MPDRCSFSDRVHLRMDEDSTHGIKALSIERQNVLPDDEPGRSGQPAIQT